MAASRGVQGNLTEGDRPERVPMTVTTSSLFPLLGVNPILGRPLLPSDEQARERERSGPKLWTLGTPLCFRSECDRTRDQVERRTAHRSWE